ncbi:nuclear transport factor 2 family protein [Kribbella shirazensis]|uniref:SnoaL-like domain-containing protein n=1 Tax=Kribbella shirazensis TaxID=1105143 RepID=A0A7X5VBZ7_9ACTN|nr:nuclear transport factor 2 family protein [Kribbella shirazensis]NIK58419.1 hypothetical protein [Kribbella shirazensis]
MTESKATTVPSTREVLERAHELFLNKDLNGFAEMFAKDGAHELPFAPPGVPKYLVGREPVRQYLTSITKTPLELKTFHNLTVHETADPEVIIAEYEARGTVVRTGKEYRMPYVQLLKARNGEILIWRDYWSPLSGVQALGLFGMLLNVIRNARSIRRMRKQLKTTP